MISAMTPLIWCIDVEPDARLIDRRTPILWEGYEKCIELFRELRPWLARVTGQTPHFSWFFRLDPQVAETYGDASWPLTHYRAELDELLASGDEVGIHPHAYRFDETLETWVIDYGDQAWVDHCVRVCFETFHDVLGRRCRSFRFGDVWMNDPTLHLVEKLGAQFDLTLEPGMSPNPAFYPGDHWTGCFPDLTDVPRTPYRPSAQDYRQPDQTRRDGILMLPLTTTRRQGAVDLAYGLLFRAQYRCAPQAVTRLNIGTRRIPFRLTADRILAQSELPYLAISMRTHMGAPRHAAQRMRRNLEYLFAHPRAPRFAIMRPDEAASTLALT